MSRRQIPVTEPELRGTVDGSPRRRAEQALREGEERYRILFKAAPDAILLTDEDGRFVDANPASCALTGYTLEELRALRIVDVVPPELHESRLTESGHLTEDFPLLCKDGTRKLVEMSASRIKLDLHLNILRDVTDQRRLQAQVAHSEKLAVMGHLLAGVAYELNSSLSVVMGQASLLCQTSGDGSGRERAEKIATAADRCARILQKFFALGSRCPPERRQVRLNQVVQEIVELLAYQLWVDNIEVMLDLALDLPSLWADPHQLHQLVVNLVSNAYQAMREIPSPRRLTLATRFDSAQGRVLLEVADTGPGIPPEIQARIFEPFFTTKPPRQGIGLGLSLCQGIVEGLRGSIRMKSLPGQGAVFLVELPVEASRVVEPEVRGAESPPPVREKAILVVDDEPEIAEVLTDLLSIDGHQVETAANGVIALEKLRTRAYDLILSDIRMPELDGPGLWRELERHHPGLLRRLVFFTADTLSPEISEFLERTGALSLRKPFALKEVRRIVQAVPGDAPRSVTLPSLAPPDNDACGAPGKSGLRERLT